MLVWVRFEGQTPVRVMGQRVYAGFPSPADDYLEDALDVSQIVVGNPTATFLWRVAGESMRDVGIFDGDLLVCDRSVTARPGDVVVAVVDGSAVVKRLQQGRGGPATLGGRSQSQEAIHGPIRPIRDAGKVRSKAIGLGQTGLSKVVMLVSLKLQCRA